MEKQQKRKISIISIIVISIILVIIVASISVWSYLNHNNHEGKVYHYTENTNYEKKVYEMYKSEIKRLLLPINTAQLYEEMDEEFLERHALTEDNFKAYLEENQLIGRDIQFKAYDVIQKGDTYLYKIYYFINENGKSVKNATINVIETRPYQYTLSFEKDAESLLSNTINTTQSNIAFSIILKESTNDTIKYEINFKNQNEQTLNIDFDDINNVQLVLTDGRRIKMASTVISSDEEVLTQGSSLKKEAVFLVPIKDQASIKGIRFEEVKIGDEVKTVTINF